MRIVHDRERRGFGFRDETSDDVTFVKLRRKQDFAIFHENRFVVRESERRRMFEDFMKIACGIRLSDQIEPRWTSGKDELAFLARIENVARHNTVDGDTIEREAVVIVT